MRSRDHGGPRSAARKISKTCPFRFRRLLSETLTQLNVQTFDDYVKYLPNVSSKTNGPGQGIIYCAD